MDREAWWATVHGITKNQIPLSDFSYFTYLGSQENGMEDRFPNALCLHSCMLLLLLLSLFSRVRLCATP